MNRDDILRKYRDENIDEGWENIHKEGLACGYIAYAIVMFLMLFINISFRYGGSEIFFWTFFLATCAIDNYSKHRFLKEKKYLRRMIFFIVWVALILLRYFLEVTGG